MLDLVKKIFGKKERSGQIAHDRLKVVLIHDRANVSPEVMDNLKNDIIKVISNYMDINQKISRSRTTTTPSRSSRISRSTA